MELTCGNCQGRFIAAVPGSIVACPHCGVHLQTPAAEAAPSTPPAPAPLPLPNVPPPAPLPFPVAADSPATSEPTPIAVQNSVEPAAVAPETLATASDPSPTTTTPTPVEAPAAKSPVIAVASAAAAVGVALSDTPELSLTETSAAAPPVSESTGSSGVLVTAPPADQALANAPGLSWVVGATATTAGEAPSLFVAETAPASDVGLSSAAAESQTVAPSSAAEPTPVSTHIAASATAEPLSPPADDPLQFGSPATAESAASLALPAPFVTSSAATRPAGVSRSAFLLAVAYAALVTLLAAYLLFLMWRGHALESLPDLAPLASGTVRIPAPRANVAPGHTLALGESRVFGYVRVTPLRVTRGSLELEARGPIGLEDRRPSGPVLKLWLKFENVSPTEDVVPLDRQLVFFRKSDKRGAGASRLMTFNFLCPRDKRKDATPPLVYVYDQPPNSALEPKGQNLEQNLGPGQSVETYIPTTAEGTSDLSGEMLWRVHFRKGHNTKTRAGVTTLIDVVFESSAIEAEPDARG